MSKANAQSKAKHLTYYLLVIRSIMYPLLGHGSFSEYEEAGLAKSSLKIF